MKKVRKLICLALAMVMAMAMCVTAYADGGTGTITVTKASKGEDYVLVKLFKATYNSTDSGIVYYELNGDAAIPTALDAYFDLKTQGSGKYVVIKDAAKAADGSLSENAVNAITTWAQGLTADDAHIVETKRATGNTVVFENLGSGYYVVISRKPETGVGGVVSVDSLAGLTQEIADKTTTDNPHFPSNGTGKVVDKKTVAVGEDVTYTVTYTTVNWLDKNGDKSDGAETQVTKYTVKDTLPSFLKDVRNVKVEVDDVDITSQVPGVANFGTTGTFDITWAESGVSKYTNNAVLKITYTATVTKDILSTDSDDMTEADGTRYHTNEVSITPNGEQPENDDKAYTDVYTGKILVQKYAANTTGAADTTKPLAGAKFILAKEDTNNTDYAKIDADGNVSWVGKEDATEVTTAANGEIKFEGLAKGTYYLEETEAPIGYNKLESRQPVVIGEATNTNITQPAVVVNKTGAQLPSTGGIGTTIFYVVGGILMLGAVVLFVTRKRSTER